MTAETASRTPGRDLSAAVRSLWYRRGGPAGQETLAAGTLTRLIIDLGAPSRVLTASGEVVAAPGGAYLIGPQAGDLVLETAAPTWQCGADLTPVGLAALSTTPLAELVGRVRGDAGAVLRWSETWPDRLRDAGSGEDALEVLQQLLRSVRRPRYAIDPRVVRAARRLEADPRIPVAVLAAEAGLGAGWFGRLFRRGAGLTPGAYARLVRSSRAAGAPSPVR